MMLFRKLLLCVVAAVGASGVAHAVPVQTIYSYVGADYRYQPGSQFTYNGDPYPKPGTDYAAILGPRLTVTMTLNGDTSNSTGVFTSEAMYNPYGDPIVGVADVAFSSGQVSFSPSMIDYFSPFQVTLVNGAVTSWSFSSNFKSISACGVGPFCDGGILEMRPTGDYLRFYIPYSGANYGAESFGPGTWSLLSVSPVPSPMVGAGLPGLLMAIAGFISWRRGRRGA
jgi:hypothetical protein